MCTGMEEKEDKSKLAFPLANAALTQKLLSLTQTCTSHRLTRKGANETSKSLNRGQCDLVILAADTDPIEILLHLPLLCEDKNVPYVFVPSKSSLGRACGVSRTVIAVAITSTEGTPYKSQVTSLHSEVEKLLSSG